MTHETNPGGPAGLTLMRARDGDMLVLMDGQGIADGETVDVAVADGVVSVSRAGGPALAGGEVDAAAGRDLARARRVTVVEFYPGDTPDGDRFVLHHDPRITVPAG